MMVIHCTQGSDEWKAARAGVITASHFKTARERLTAGKHAGEFKAAAQKLAFRLAIERISKTPLDEGFETWQMRRGHELEPDARLKHQALINDVVHTCGVVLTDDWAFGASADGLIGDDGGAEYKCLVSPDTLMPVLLDANIDDYRDQVQGCMWLTGRQWWDFCLYCPALADIGRDLTRLRIPRDDAYIDGMVDDLMQFKQLVDTNEARLRRN